MIRDKTISMQIVEKHGGPPRDRTERLLCLKEADVPILLEAHLVCAVGFEPTPVRVLSPLTLPLAYAHKLGGCPEI